MYDALLADHIDWAEDGAGVTVRAGQVIYLLDASHRDAADLTARREGVVTVQLEVSETELALIGFSSRQRRGLYRALRAVKGVGRRTALLVLDCGETLDTLRAVAGADSEYFAAIPGLGKARVSAVIDQLAGRYRDTMPSPLPVPVSAWVTARDALVAAGRSDDQAERALRDVTQSASAPRTAQALLAAAERA